MARHLFALEYLTRVRTCTIGTCMTMVLGTMSHRSAGLAVSLDSALESFSLGNSSCINLVACSEDISFNLILYRILFCIVETEFSNKSLISDTSL